MKILESYKKIAKSMLTEHAWDRKFGEPLPTLEDVMAEASQDDEDYVHIGYGKYKDKDHVDDPSAPTFKKTDSGAFVPFKDKEKGTEPEDDREEPEEPKGKGAEPSDFERDFGGDTGTDADFQGEPPEGAREPDDVDDEPKSEPADSDHYVHVGDGRYRERDSKTGRALMFSPTYTINNNKFSLASDDDQEKYAAKFDEVPKDEPKDETVIINGKKYRPIKEKNNG